MSNTLGVKTSPVHCVEFSTLFSAFQKCGQNHYFVFTLLLPENTVSFEFSQIFSDYF